MLGEFIIEVAGKKHLEIAHEVSAMISEAAAEKSSGLALRSPEYLKSKIIENKAIVAFHGDELAGFCYIELWGNKSFIANSGLVVKEKFRGTGLAKEIKEFAFNYSRKSYPNAKIFGLTTNPAVMKINSELGYRPEAYYNLTTDEEFWEGCRSCSNFDILQRTSRQRCLCTAMLYDPFELNVKDIHKLKKQSILVGEN